MTPIGGSKVRWGSGWGSGRSCCRVLLGRPAGLSLLRSVVPSGPRPPRLSLHWPLSLNSPPGRSSQTRHVDFTYALSNLSLMLTSLFFSHSTRIQIIFYCAENSYGIDKKIRVGQGSNLVTFRTTHTWRRRSNQLSHQIAQTLTSYTSDQCFR